MESDYLLYHIIMGFKMWVRSVNCEIRSIQGMQLYTPAKKCEENVYRILQQENDGDRMWTRKGVVLV